MKTSHGRILVLASTLFSLAGLLQAAPTPIPSPLSLREALAHAAENNPGLQATREQIRENEGVLLTVRSSRLPTVSASAAYTALDDALVSGPTGVKLADDRKWTADVVVSQIIYAGGAVSAGTRAQREQVEAARLSYAAALNDAMLLVCQRYYNVLLAAELVTVNEEYVRLLSAELQRARDRRVSGVASNFEVLRAEVTLANAQPALIQARNDYRVSQDLLRQALGSQELEAAETAELRLRDGLEVEPYQVALADALARARAKRAELLRQERVVEAARQGKIVASSGYRPTVSAFAGYEWDKASWSSRVGDSLDGWKAGIQANWAIFDGRSTAGKLQQARSQLRQLELGSESMAQSVAVEVKQAHSALTEAVELLASSAKVVEQALESLRLAEARYSAGSATQLDVLEAQTSLTQARSNQAQARHAHAVAVAALKRAMGELSSVESGR